MHILKQPLSIAFLAQSALAVLYTDSSQLPKSEYDFVVVGAGTAGNVVASRLSENPAFSILVIEAGGDNAGIEELEIPFNAPAALGNASLFWNYTTTPQIGLNGRTLAYQRGRVLGGSSSVNFLVFTRGSRDDFDRYANVTGDDGWSWNSMFPFMLKAENFVAPVDHHNTSGQFNASAHGYRGPLLTTLPGFPSAIDPRFIATTETNSSLLPFNLDANAGDTIGLSWMQSTAGHGVRSSSATAYLQPVLHRPNLDVLINAQVTRLLSTGDENGIPVLRKVELSQTSSGPRTIVRAKKEVILSAGPVNTPQLLLLSGIGDRGNLSALSIPTIVHSPGVGRNLQDHPLVANQWFVNANNTLDDISRNATLANELLEQWRATKTGQYADGPANQIAWLRLPPDPAVFGGFGDPSAGPTSSHIELLLGNSFASFLEPPPPNGSYISVSTNVVSPSSRGSITLSSADPFDFPVIDAGFLTHPLDIKIMAQAIRTAMAILSTPSFQGFVLAPHGALANATTTSELEAYIRNSVTTFWHVCCTAKMGTSEDATAVVDSELNLKGVHGVRVVDFSVLPFLPAAHPQAAVYALAERAAHLIQSRWAA
ncbi:aryl-alcohol oxidase-like protein [Artomyces pyxidatus]|uniref:Aryl-alcohol oxidase-like protein n=1 Tax=Artomyces pyxidatus TaxID=48021 RepID=A0ACB8T1F2_9AGAM|nr:aryl-alcohol oxidase-like protein [Artomyces pyxidatus]